MWQAIYLELKDQGFEMIAVAFDTAGTAAVEASIRCANIKDRPPVLARLTGWSDDLWARQAPPTYPCLIDEGHVVAELYNMRNVPQAVWLDEQGRIVRPRGPSAMDLGNSPSLMYWYKVLRDRPVRC